MEGREEREEGGEGRQLVDRTWAHYTGEITSTAYSKRKQVLATFCATLGCLLNGAVIGYSSPAIPSLLSNSTNVNIYGGHTVLTLQQTSWMTSLLSIGCFLGCLCAGPIMEKLGRRKTLMIVSASSYALGFLAILLAHTPLLIYIGRFLNGVGLGLVLATVSVYIVEIATTDMRGILGCFVQFLGSVGVLATFCLGSVLTWWQLSLAHLITVIPFSVAMIFVPESPRWLIMKGNEWQGEVALKWLRGRGPEAIDREIDIIKKEIAIRKRERQSITLLLEPHILKPFIISMMMMFFLQMSGFNVMVFYCGIIFKESGSSISSNNASIIVGCVLLLSCFVALAVVSQLGRKVILVLSILGMSLSHLLLGTCFYLKEQALLNNSIPLPEGVSETLNVSSVPGPVSDEEYVSPVGWLPLLAIIAFLFLGNVGYGTLIWVVTAELLPPKVRAMANSIIICFAFITGFIVAKTFVDLVQSGLKRSGTFWLYGSICLLGGIFTIIFVPETRNKTMEEIQAIFRGKGKKAPGEHPGLGHPLDSVT